uniref:DHH family protein n=1 Tax=viral metagenome TaxID=1070528 RepID=A0A6M3L1Z1_9ZZZZ
MKVFYHNDNDGKCAAHIVDRYYNLDPPDHASQLLIKYYPMEYGKQFPIEDVIKDEKVYILDYSIEPEEMKELLEITKDVIWIDHHKSAIEKYDDLLSELHFNGDDIEGYRAITFSGCELTWLYLHPPNEGKEMPEYVNLIGDRDTWRWEHGDKTKYFHYGLGMSSCDPLDEIWQMAMRNVNTIIGSGTAISVYVQEQSINAINERGFWIDFHGFKTYAINSDLVRSSEFFEQARPDAQIWMTFRFIPNSLRAHFEGYWTISLYSKEVDVSQIANQYEYEGKIGGGHAGASGFQSADLSFLKD